MSHPARTPSRSLQRAAQSRLSGAAIVEGIALGRAVVWEPDPTPPPVSGTMEEERARLRRAVARAVRGVEELARRLPPSEAELFAPEITILRELWPDLRQRVEDGLCASDAVEERTSRVPIDLIVDARARILDGLALEPRSVEALLDGRDGDRVLVTETLAPSVVAALPSRVVGILAPTLDEGAEFGAGPASHAAILARARGIPLVLVPLGPLRRIAPDLQIVVDATASPAVVWIAPEDRVIGSARERRDAWEKKRADEEALLAAPLPGLPVTIAVNVASLDERVPVLPGGIGLVRTELLFSSRHVAPSLAEQSAALRVLSARVGGASVVVRLFDSGGDKPLAWLPAKTGRPARGIGLLLQYPEVLGDQLGAIARAAERGAMQALLPFVTSADEVRAVLGRAPTGLAIGAMIETPDAVADVDAIAAVADFISIGTNDLNAAVTGKDRAHSALALDPAVLEMIARVVARSHAVGKRVSVCGEMAGEVHGARVLVGLGVDGLSMSVTRLATITLALRDATLEDCRRVAVAARVPS